MSEFDTLVFIGRFQPFHKGHRSVIQTAVESAKREVIIVVGSSFASRSMRNPFTFEERKAMIKAEFPQEKVKVVPVMDYPYNDNKWIAAIKRAVHGAMDYTPDPYNIGLIGYSKDDTSYYLKIFPGWDHINVDAWIVGAGPLNATDIRKDVLSDVGTFESYEKVMAVSTIALLHTIMSSEAGKTLREEYKIIEQYKEQFAGFPYGDPKFLTADAVVHQTGKILLVKRKAAPGKGLWALPGGFVNKGERMFDAAFRELVEETNIKVPMKVLKNGTKEKIFDAPYRSDRGRTVTMAQFIDLAPSTHLPKVKASDDAEEVAWVDIFDIDTSRMFEDHAAIIDYFLNYL